MNNGLGLHHTRWISMLMVESRAKTRITRRCTVAGCIFGFSTSFASFQITGCSTVTRVSAPGDLGCHVQK
ncbi:MAG: hypothetical protein ACYTBP_08160 [Planctomycetota bacterium]